MISKALLKKSIKDSWKFWLLITLVLCLFLVMFLSITVVARNNMGDRGGEMAADTVIEQFYTMFAVALPMIFVAITANKLIASQVDKGSLSYVMVNPVKRNKVSITQGTFLAGSVILMYAAITVVGLAANAIAGAGIGIGYFLLLNLGALLLMLAISGISFLASCHFNRSSSSLAVGIGVPIAFLLFSFLGNLSGLADFMKIFQYLTINSLFNITHIAGFSLNLIWEFLLLFAIFAGCYVTGIIRFKKKDLPL